MRTTTCACRCGGRTTPNGRFSRGKSVSSRNGTQQSFCISEVAASRLIALDRLEQRFEVALTETAGTAALDDLKEEDRAIRNRFGKDLQQISAPIAVHEDAQALERIPRELDAAEPTAGIVVVRVGHPH